MVAMFRGPIKINPLIGLFGYATLIPGLVERKLLFSKSHRGFSTFSPLTYKHAPEFKPTQFQANFTSAPDQTEDERSQVVLW